MKTSSSSSETSVSCVEVISSSRGIRLAITRYIVGRLLHPHYFDSRCAMLGEILRQRFKKGSGDLISGALRPAAGVARPARLKYCHLLISVIAGIFVREPRAGPGSAPQLAHSQILLQRRGARVRSGRRGFPSTAPAHYQPGG